jgi:hypothetical protein
MLKKALKKNYKFSGPPPLGRDPPILDMLYFCVYMAHHAYNLELAKQIVGGKASVRFETKMWAKAYLKFVKRTYKR